MEWEHKEQDALEHVYTAQPQLRTHVAFIPQRKINSFPLAACGKKNDEGEDMADPRFHYSQRDRDFLVNMAGCEWGRDCWSEMYEFRELSIKLNRNIWQKIVHSIKDRISPKKSEMSDDDEQVLTTNNG